MRINGYKDTFSLEAKNIDVFSEVLDKALLSIRTERQNRLRIRLSMEEALLRFRDRFGEEIPVTATITSRFGRPLIQIELEGDPCNPLTQTETDLDDWNSSLMTAIGLSPRYNYIGRRNILKLILPVKGLNPILKIFISLVSGVLIGIIGTHCLSAETQDTINYLILEPFYDIWNHVLNLLSGPVIFFMVITTILNARKITERGGDSRGSFIRYSIISLLTALLGIIAGFLVFRFSMDQLSMNVEETSQVFRKMSGLIPSEFFTPFMEANTPQLLTMAVVIGNALYLIGTQTEELNRIIRQLNMMCLLLAEWVSRLVPFFVSILIIYDIWEGRTKWFTGTLWKCLLVSLTVSVLFMMTMICFVSIRKGISIRLLIRKLWPSFFLTLQTGSLNDSYGETVQCCIHKLGIDKGFTSFSLLHGLVLYMPVSVIGTMIMLLYAARLYQVTITPLWLGTAAVLGVFLFVATPPVPGANLLAYITIFAQLGIPQNALIAAMIYDVLFGLFASAANQTMLQLELVLQADRIGLLNREKLKQP